MKKDTMKNLMTAFTLYTFVYIVSDFVAFIATSVYLKKKDAKKKGGDAR